MSTKPCIVVFVICQSRCVRFRHGPRLVAFELLLFFNLCVKSSLVKKEEMAEQLQSQDNSRPLIHSNQDLFSNSNDSYLEAFRTISVKEEKIQATNNASYSVQMFDLPTEILEKICKGIDDANTISNVRLTCSLAAEIGLRCLVPKITILQTRHSLDRLANIANHPVLRHRVFKIDYIPAAIPLSDSTQVSSASTSRDGRGCFCWIFSTLRCRNGNGTSLRARCTTSFEMKNVTCVDHSVHEREVLEYAIAKLSHLSSFNFVRLEFSLR